MQLLKKAKEFLPEGTIRREKKEKRTLPKARTHGKKIRFFVWICIFLIAVSGILAYIKASKVEMLARDIKDNVNQIQSQDGDTVGINKDSHTKILFVEDFLKHYMNIPQSSEERNGYSEKVLTYYAEGLQPEDVSGVEGYRALKNLEYFDTTQEAKFSVVKYKVTYSNIVVVEKERKKKKKGKEATEKYEEKQEKGMTVIMNVPVQEKDGKYSVVEHVYASAIPKLTSDSIAANANSMEGMEELIGEDREGIEGFIQEFFHKYAEAPVEDLTYVMKIPEGLNGLKELVELNEIKIYQYKEQIIVKAVPMFQDKGTDWMAKENFTLVLIKQETNYFVESLTHSIGGN